MQRTSEPIVGLAAHADRIAIRLLSARRAGRLPEISKEAIHAAMHRARFRGVKLAHWQWMEARILAQLGEHAS